jgi:hypothetical protein
LYNCILNYFFLYRERQQNLMVRLAGPQVQGATAMGMAVRPQLAMKIMI